MDEPLIIFSTKDSSLLAYGVSRKSRFRPLFVVIVLALIIALTTWLVWLTFRPVFRLPQTTAALVSVTPKTAFRLLPTETRDQLPTLWREIVNTRSNWPVIFGLYKTANGWKTLAMVPRWLSTRSTLHRQDVWLLSLVSEEELDRPGLEIRYTDQWAWRHTDRTSPLALFLNPNTLFNLPTNAPDPDLSPFTATYRDGIFSTDVSLKAPNEANITPQGDLFIAIPTAGLNSPIYGALLGEISLGNLLVSQLTPTPSAVAISLDQSQKPEQINLFFQDELNRRQINQVMSGLELTRRQALQLPNGETMYENTPWFEQDVTLPTTTQTKFGQATLSDHGVELKQLATSSGQESSALKSSRCQGEPTWAVLSPTIGRLLLAELFHAQISTVPQITFVAKQSVLTMCLD